MERLNIKEVNDVMVNKGAPGPPWGWQPSLQAMAEEAGVNFDDFIDYIRDGATDEEMAWKFGVSVETIACLRDRFERYGIDSVMGQD